MFLYKLHRWFNNIMLKKKVKAIYAEIGEEYNHSEKRSIVAYILMDPDERTRINLPRIPSSFKVSISSTFYVQLLRS